MTKWCFLIDIILLFLYDSLSVFRRRSNRFESKAGFVGDKDFYKKALFIAIPLMLQQLISTSVNFTG
ncbi:hypothetical protein [Erysipelothrix piscisicarius]|uniref:hypothetical protein n=1 Tax=Erysipelothrix piscisicarius TaxID=2485784 RepID=UPI002F93BDF9